MDIFRVYRQEVSEALAVFTGTPVTPFSIGKIRTEIRKLVCKHIDMTKLDNDIR